MKIFNAGQQIEVPGQILYDFASASVLYVGEALPGTDQADSAWQIKRITFDGAGNPVKTEWAGAGSQTNQWSQRSVLPYS